MAAPNPKVAEFTEALVAATEFMSAVVDVVAGYRNQLINAGIGEAAADAMAVEFHAHVIHIMKAASSGS